MFGSPKPPDYNIYQIIISERLYGGVKSDKESHKPNIGLWDSLKRGRYNQILLGLAQIRMYRQSHNMVHRLLC